MWKDVPDDREARVVLVGMPLHRLSRQHQLPCLAILVLVSSILGAALQERVLYVPGFRYTGWLAFLTSLTYMLLAMLERFVEKDTLRRGSLVEYVKLSFLTMGGMYFTNFSLHYLSYSLRVVFKSSKLVPVMLLGVVYLKKHYTPSQYLAVGLLTAGVVVFTLGDAKGRAFFNPMGIAFIMAGSLSDAMAANYEEKVFFSRMGCSASEVVLYSSALGSVWALLAEAVTGELLPAWTHSRDHLEAVPLMLVASVFGYVAQSGVLLLIKHFGATAAEIVKSCRKVTTILISFMVYGKAWNGYHVAGTLLFVNSVAVERFHSGKSSKRFATFLFSLGALVALRLLLGGIGPSTFSVVIDAGSAGTRVNVFRFDAWTLKLLDMNGAAQIFVEEEPGIGDLNSSALERQMSRLLAAALGAVPMGQRSVTPLALRATRALQDLSNEQVDDLLDQMKGHIAKAGFKDAGVQPMGGSEEAIAEWMTVNMLMGCFQPGLRGVHSPVAIVDLGGATVQMAYYLHDRQASEAKRQNLDTFVSRVTLPFGSGPANIYRHSYAGYGLHSAKVRSYKELPQAGFALSRHPCLPQGVAVQLRVERKMLVAEGAMNKFSCETLMDHILHRELPCQDPRTAGPPKMGNCSFAGAWMGPGVGQQQVVLASYFYDRMRDVGVVSNYSQTLRAGVFAEQADRVCSVSSQLNSSAVEFQSLPMERLLWLCFDLTFQARLLKALGIAESRELLVVKKIRYHTFDFEASWALGVAIGQLNK